MTISGLFAACARPTGYQACHVALWIWRTGPVLLLALGTCGNVLAVAILCRQRLRKYATTVYLQFLSAANLVTLWTFTLKHALLFIGDIDIDTLSEFSCRLRHWLFQTAATFSVWLLVLLTVERVLYTLWPTTARMKLTRRLAKCSSLAFMSVIGLFSAHYIVGYELKYTNAETTSNVTNVTLTETTVTCAEVSAFYRSMLERYLRPIGSLLFIAIPVVILVVGNILVKVGLVQQSKRVALTGSVPNTSRIRRYIQTTRRLFILCATFTICMLPYGLFAMVYHVASPTWTASQFATANLLYAIFYNVLLCNFAFNCLYYTFGWTIFKQELVTVLKRTATDNTEIETNL